VSRTEFANGAALYEIGMELTSGELELLEHVLSQMKIPYYIEPPSRNRTLEELEADCEGK